ncbi:hypothetical protein NC651_032826 [Populus alba x Populus x berolinensis]|uniref:DUF538 domain-containing protein n=1 Tax=Populus davidiana TaxID=266767 RepID=A0A6M2EYX1_9ROSI|nr:hypothetical protein NC651_032826 [Populus alba x Populus x berolinensis]
MKKMLRLICSLSFLLISVPTVYSDKNQSFYDVLKAHGLPMGLLPKGVKEFDIDETGRFEVHLDQACNAKFESELHYDMNVTGSLSYGQIGALSGISAQELFLWFPVKGIRVDVPSSGLIYFDVGVVFKQFSLSLFEMPRDCVAVRDDEIEAVRHGKFIADAVAKSQSGKLRYGLDQENFGRDFL